MLAIDVRRIGQPKHFFAQLAQQIEANTKRAEYIHKHGVNASSTLLSDSNWLICAYNGVIQSHAAKRHRKYLLHHTSYLCFFYIIDAFVDVVLIAVGLYFQLFLLKILSIQALQGLAPSSWINYYGYLVLVDPLLTKTTMVDAIYVNRRSSLASTRHSQLEKNPHE